MFCLLCFVSLWCVFFSFKFWVMCCLLLVVYCVLCFTCCVLRVISCVLFVLCCVLCCLLVVG